MGTWRTFDVRGAAAEQHARTIVDTALAAGAGFFDTSPMYGAAERLLGATLRERRSQALVATKVWAATVVEGRIQIERALGFFSGIIELYQIHNLLNWREQLVLLEQERDAGRVRTIGATHYSPAAFGELQGVIESGRVAAGGPVDVWGFSLGALTATSLAVRHPAKVRRLVLAASNIRMDGYHPEITAPEQDDPRLPTQAEFEGWQAAYDAVAPNPADFMPFLERMQPVVHEFAGWTDDEIRSIAAPTFLVIGDRDFVRLDHAAEMLDLFPDCRLLVLPATRHTEVMQRTDELRALVSPFLS